MGQGHQLRLRGRGDRRLEPITNWQSSNDVSEQRRRGCDDPYRKSSDGAGPEAIGPVLSMT